ncbi:hypothetical protein KEM54_003072 [Ascosphaera aggregata]|nr:hypothetical protein KEM54_003072 [Ascosphaera aggregata]
MAPQASQNPANQALCFYCFEVLAGALQSVEPPRLAAVQALFNLYEASRQTAETVAAAAAAASLEDISVNVDQDKWKVTISTWRRTASPGKITTTSGNCWTASETLRSRLYEDAEIEYPLFVTWNTVSVDGDKILRGCIGIFEDQPLEVGLNYFTIQSAFHDHRFKPISSSTVPSLSCSVTLLADFEDCSDPFDWIIGTHGIRIMFSHANRHYGATYLPDVASEQGWTKEETLRSLMIKAGYTEYPGIRVIRDRSIRSLAPWENVDDFKVVRYKGLKVSAKYIEWLRFREWASLDAERLKILAEER